MRAIAIIVILAVVGFFGYQYAAKGRSPSEAVGVLSGATQQAEAAAEAAAAEAEEAAANAAAELQAATEEAAAEAEAAANAALEEAQAAAAEEAVEGVATEVAEGNEDLMAMATSGDLLTVDGFDADKVVALLDTMDIPEGEKATLATALGFAKNNPVLLQPVLDNIKTMLDM